MLGLEEDTAKREDEEAPAEQWNGRSQAWDNLVQGEGEEGPKGVGPRDRDWGKS